MSCQHLQWTKHPGLQKLLDESNITGQPFMAWLISRCVYSASAQQHLMQQGLQTAYHAKAFCAKLVVCSRVLYRK